MPICGYNPKMGAAVTELAEGLITALREKAHQQNMSMSEQMTTEEEELATFADMLECRDGVSSKGDQQAWLGLVHLVRFLMQPQESGTLTREVFEAAVRTRAKEFDGKMITFEDAFYSSNAPLCERLKHALAASTD